MKKIIILSQLVLFASLLSACGSNNYEVGASAVPHAEILEFAQPIMEEQGYEFEITKFSDYIMPNESLASGEIIANFYQHIPYLESQIEERGYDFVNVGGVHFEPIGLYSKTHDSLEDLPSELELIISNSPSDRPRLLEVLEENGLITIDDDVEASDIVDASLGDLSDLFTSDHAITFEEVDAPLLAPQYDKGSGDAVLINGNFALDYGLNPNEDALALEDNASDYANVLVTTSEHEDDPFIEALIEVLQSEEVKDFILEEYKGGAMPVE